MEKCKATVHVKWPKGMVDNKRAFEFVCLFFFNPKYTQFRRLTVITLTCCNQFCLKEGELHVMDFVKGSTIRAIKREMKI